ncbi:MAG: response regulator [Bacillota bacterium]
MLTPDRDPQKKVIIIDQSNFMRTTIKILLFSKGCDIYEADEETKAVSLTANKKPGLILMSLGFAKLNRMKLVNTLKNLHKCPVILYSNIITREDVILSYKSSADDVLLKPLQQCDRMVRYFLLTPSEVRRHYLHRKGEVNIEFNLTRDWNPKSKAPVREGGRMKWDRKSLH